MNQQVPTVVTSLEDLGRYQLATARLGEARVQALLPEGHPLPAQPALQLPREHLRVYQDGRSLEAAR